jgi:hypothetical protein
MGNQGMKKGLTLSILAAIAVVGAAKADPVDLSAYVDANGYLDVQALTCAQEDANLLAAWYSGWYNGLAHKHYLDWKNIREGEHLVIKHCQEHPDEKIIHAIDVVVNELRKAHGIKAD